jgi:hypothetical protein
MREWCIIFIYALIITERACLKGGRYMEDNMKEFVAFSRKLLRSLKEIRELLDTGDKESAIRKLDELIEDTQKDIEA